MLIHEQEKLLCRHGHGAARRLVRRARDAPEKAPLRQKHARQNPQNHGRNRRLRLRRHGLVSAFYAGRKITPGSKFKKPGLSFGQTGLFMEHPANFEVRCRRLYLHIFAQKYSL